MVELLAWLASKQGAQVLLNAPRSYEAQDRRVDGRSHLRLVSPLEPAVEVEVCLAPSAASVHKLLAAYREGAQALMVCGFAITVCEATEKLSKVTGLKHWGWLSLACLGLRVRET